ncbi:MAG: tetratricopeptide repeat protein [Planctomycetaceae bacterium]|jgi:predicted Zn-dependent protease
MPKREKLEALLQESPDDTFLNYALALQLAAEGDVRGGIDRLTRLSEREPGYVPTWFQLGQLLAQAQETERAKQVLAKGIEMARRSGDQHAEGEMRGLLDSLP